jgi:hypothetical protein
MTPGRVSPFPSLVQRGQIPVPVVGSAGFR